jgi:hypothetical protein
MGVQSVTPVLNVSSIAESFAWFEWAPRLRGSPNCAARTGGLKSRLVVKRDGCLRLASKSRGGARRQPMLRA